MPAVAGLPIPHPHGVWRVPGAGAFAPPLRWFPGVVLDTAGFSVLRVGVLAAALGAKAWSPLGIEGASRR